MSRILNIVFLASLFFQGVLAAESGTKSLEAATQDVAKKNKDFSESLKGLKAQTIAAEKAVEEAKKELKSAELWATREDKNPIRKNRLQAAQEKLAAAEKTRDELTKQEGDLGKASTELVQKVAAVSTTSAEVKVQAPALGTALASQSLMLEFSKLSNQIGGVDLALEKIASEYDRTLLGAYLKDKMGLLLNS